MRAIVTGGAGFVGSHLVESLVARGDDVVCLERPGATRGWVDGLPLEFAAVGLAEPSVLDRILEGADIVFHLAALTSAPRAERYYAVNTEGTANVMAAAARSERPPRVILMSSLAATGPCRNGDTLSERTVPYPLSHYGHSKLLAEVVVRAHRDVPHTILRFPPIYGPRERQILIMYRLVRRGVAFTVGSWDREISLIYVTDAVRALLAAANRSCAVGRTYTVAHPEPVTWRQFADEVGLALGRSPRFVALPQPLALGVAVAAEAAAAVSGRAAVLNRQKVREMTQKRWVCDATTAAHALECEPGFPVERGVVATARWYEEEGWL